MENFVLAVEAVLPLVIFLLLGVWLNKRKIISQDGFAEFNTILFNVLLPILVFDNIYNADLSDVWSSSTLIYISLFYILNFLLYIIIVYLVEKDNRKRSVMLQGITRGSAVLFGLPLANNILASSQLATVSLAATLSIPFNSILPIFCFVIFMEGKASFKDSLKKLLTNPIMVAAIIGLVIKMLGINLPKFILNASKSLSRASTPLSFILLGGTFRLSTSGIKDKSLWFTVISKLFIFPGLALAIAYALGMRNADLIAVLVASAGPTSVVSYPQAVSSGGDAELANNIVVYTTLFAIITVVVLLGVLSSVSATQL